MKTRRCELDSIGIRLRILTVLAAISLMGYACDRQKVEDGSNSNWLGYCESSLDCDGDGSCICGLCTRTCESDDACVVDGIEGFCVEPFPASESGGCAAVVSEAQTKICLPGCRDDDDCGDKSNCISGACWPDNDDIIDERGLSRSDAGEDVARPTVSNGLRSNYDASRLFSTDNVDAAFDFSEPIDLPAPDTAIFGDVSKSALIGVWNESPAETTVFLPANIELVRPMRLVIEEEQESGELVGSISFLCKSGLCDPSEPPPEAVDPDVAYPPELNQLQESDLTSRLSIFINSVIPRFNYRIFDGRISGQRFTFWFSTNDLWRDWCGLQTSYPFEEGDRVVYSCVPDYVKFLPLSTPDGPSVKTITNAKEGLCSIDKSVCACNKAGCEADYRDHVFRFDMVLRDDVLEGTLTFNETEYYRVTFVRAGEETP